jgi:hypothetical protein
LQPAERKWARFQWASWSIPVARTQSSVEWWAAATTIAPASAAWRDPHSIPMRSAITSAQRAALSAFTWNQIARNMSD